MNHKAIMGNYAILLAVCLGLSPAYAASIYDNFSHGDTYPGSNWRWGIQVR